MNIISKFFYSKNKLNSIYEHVLIPYCRLKYAPRFKKFGKHSTIVKPDRIIGADKIDVGSYVNMMHHIRIEALKEWNNKKLSPAIIIGNNVTINQNCHITCANRLYIGCGTAILPDVLLTDIEHEYQSNKPIAETGLVIGSLHIGKNVTIGMGAKILGSTFLSIGDGAVIGANAVVTHDVPAGAVVAGIPAKLVRYIKEEGDDL